MFNSESKEVIKYANDDLIKINQEVDRLKIVNNQNEVKIQEKEMLINKLENIDITKYNKYVIYNHNLAWMVIALILGYISVTILFGVLKIV